MVQLFSTFFVLASLIVAGISAPDGKRSVAQVKDDMKVISSDVTKLDRAITAFTGTTPQAIEIHSAVPPLESSMEKGTTDVMTTGHFNEADGKDILASVQAFEPTILHALKTIIDKKPMFKPAFVPMVKQDLKNLRAKAIPLADALIAAAPDDLKSQAKAIRAEIGAGFDKAIAAYSN